MRAQISTVLSETGGFFTKTVKIITRRRETAIRFTKFEKNLNFLDITFICLGTGLGVGPYLFLGRNFSMMGPAMVIAYVLGGLAASLSAASYAELVSHGGGGPGGAYNIIYQHVGELPGLTLGWGILVQGLGRTALVCSALAEMVNQNMNGRIGRWIFENIGGFHSPFLASTPKLLSFGGTLVATLGLALIAKYLHKINNVFVAINLVQIMLIITMAGAIIEWKFWKLPPRDGCGEGGFLPYGFLPILNNTALVFFGYSGFDSAAHSYAEVHQPNHMVPLTMLLTVGILSLLYLFQTFVHSLSSDYCNQRDLEATSYLFKEARVEFISILTSVLIPIVVFASICSVLYPVTRTLYALSEDGLIMEYFSQVDAKSKQPLRALVAAGLIASVLAFFQNTFQLAALTNLCALLSYAAIAAAVIHLRTTDIHLEEPRRKPFWRHLFNLRPRSMVPNIITSKIAAWSTIAVLLISFTGLFILDFQRRYSILLGSQSDIVGIVVGVIGIPAVLVLFVIIKLQPENDKVLIFKMRFFPAVPFLCMIVNLYLSMRYGSYTWLKCLIIYGLMLLFYLIFGISHSKVPKVVVEADHELVPTS